MRGENLFQSLQRLVTLAQRLDALALRADEFQARMLAQLDTLEGQMADVRERLVRLESFREADRAQMQADLARFKAEVERAEYRIGRLLPGQPAPPALPEDEDDLP